jgi:group I intron endonuclease
MYSLKDFKIGVIYRYVSPSGKCYVGQTIDEASRKAKHKKDSGLKDTHFGTAIRKYGFENFRYEIIIKFKPTIDKEKLKRVLNKLEIRYIKLYDSINNGYNLMTGGDSSTHSQETIDKISKYAQNKSPEHIEKLRQAQTGKVIPDIVRQKQSEGQNEKKKKVQKYDLEENLIEEFNSIADAARSIEGLVQKTKSNKIGECCGGSRKTIYGFIWKFRE